MLEKLQTLKTNAQDWIVENGVKVCLTISSVAGSVMSMTIQSSAVEGSTVTSDIPGTVDTIISCMTKGYTFIMGQPVLATCFVGGIVGTLVFGNIKKAKRAVK